MIEKEIQKYLYEKTVSVKVGIDTENRVLSEEYPAWEDGAIAAVEYFFQLAYQNESLKKHVFLELKTEDGRFGYAFQNGKSDIHTHGFYNNREWEIGEKIHIVYLPDESLVESRHSITGIDTWTITEIGSSELTASLNYTNDGSITISRQQFTDSYFATDYTDPSVRASYLPFLYAMMLPITSFPKGSRLGSITVCIPDKDIDLYSRFFWQCMIPLAQNVLTHPSSYNEPPKEAAKEFLEQMESDGWL